MLEVTDTLKFQSNIKQPLTVNTHKFCYQCITVTNRDLKLLKKNKDNMGENILRSYSS